MLVLLLLLPPPPPRSVGLCAAPFVRSFALSKKCNCVYIIKIRSMLCNIHIIYTMYMNTNSMHEEYMKRFDKHFRTEKWHQQRIRIHCFLVVCKTFNNKRKSKSKVRMNHHPNPAPASPSMSTHPYAAAPPRRTHESCVRRRMFGRKKKKINGLRMDGTEETVAILLTTMTPGKG